MRLCTGMFRDELERNLRLANNLKSLELLMDCYEEDYFELGWNLNQAIATRARTLVDLVVSTDGKAGYTMILGDERRLGCLPDMKKLRVLHIETSLIFYKKSKMAELDLHAILPPNLRELRLEECWYVSDEDSDDMSPNDYAKLLLSKFKTLASFRDEKLPKLEMVQFWSWEWLLEDSDNWQHWTRPLSLQFMQQSSKLFRAAKVKFSPPIFDKFPEPLVRHSENDRYIDYSHLRSLGPWESESETDPEE